MKKIKGLRKLAILAMSALVTMSVAMPTGALAAAPGQHGGHTGSSNNDAYYDDIGDGYIRYGHDGYYDNNGSHKDDIHNAHNKGNAEFYVTDGSSPVENYSITLVGLKQAGKAYITKTIPTDSDGYASTSGMDTTYKWSYEVGGETHEIHFEHGRNFSVCIVIGGGQDENTDPVPSGDENPGDEDKDDKEVVPGDEDKDDKEVIPGDEDKDDKEVIPGDEDKDDKEVVPGDEDKDDIEVIPGDEDKDDKEVIPGDEDKDDKEAVPGDEDKDDKEVIPGDEDKDDKDVIPGDEDRDADDTEEPSSVDDKEDVEKDDDGYDDSKGKVSENNDDGREDKAGEDKNGSDNDSEKTEVVTVTESYSGEKAGNDDEKADSEAAGAIIDTPSPADPGSTGGQAGSGNADASVNGNISYAESAADTNKPVVIEDGAVPMAASAKVLKDSELPLAAVPGEDASAGTSAATWSLINLICLVLTALMTLVTLLGKANAGKRIMMILSIIPTVAAAVAFALTQNLAGSMILADKWTVMMLIIAAVNAVIAVMAIRNMTKDEDNDTAVA